MSNEEDKYFNIQMASQLSGLSAHTIRAWEKRYNALTPERSDNGRRQYSSLEVERLNLLARLTNLGNSISQVAQLPDDELKVIYLKLTQHSAHSFETNTGEVIKESHSEEVIKNILISLKAYRVDEVSKVLQQLSQQYSIKELALKIIKPLLLEVKELEKQNIFNKAQVQALNAILKFHSGNIIYSHYEKKTKSKNKIALTTIEDDYELTNLMLTTLLCCHHQLNFFFLNSNLPTDSILEACKSIDTNILVLTLSPLRSESKDTKEILSKIMNQISSKTEVWILCQNPNFSFNESFKNIKFYKTLTDMDAALEKVL